MSTIQFSIRMDPKIRDRLEREAKGEDRSASYIAQKAIDDYLKRKDHLRQVVREAEAEAEKGDFISGDAMHAWIASWDTDKELPEPKADIVRAKTARGSKAGKTSGARKK